MIALSFRFRNQNKVIYYATEETTVVVVVAAAVVQPFLDVASLP